MTLLTSWANFFFFFLFRKSLRVNSGCIKCPVRENVRVILQASDFHPAKLSLLGLSWPRQQVVFSSVRKPLMAFIVWHESRLCLTCVQALKISQLRGEMKWKVAGSEMGWEETWASRRWKRGEKEMWPIIWQFFLEFFCSQCCIGAAF